MSSSAEYPNKAQTLNSDRDRRAFGELLALAEEVKAKEETLRARILVGVGATAGLITGIAAVAAVLLQNSSISVLLSSPFAALFAGIAMSAYMGSGFLYITAQRQIRRERLAFKEVMGIIHELYETTRYDLSPIETAEIKIRLSRLDH